MTKFSGQHPVVLFDGVCNLCHGTVRFIVDRDPDAVFRFAPLESEVGRRLVAGAYAGGQAPDSVILLEDGRPYEGSEVALRIASRLGPPWSALLVLRIVPAGIREWAYRAVARRRYGWFGRMDACPVPDQQLRERFLSSS